MALKYSVKRASGMPDPHAADVAAAERWCQLARAAAASGDEPAADYCRGRADHAWDRAEAVLGACAEGSQNANVLLTQREEQG